MNGSHALIQFFVVEDLSGFRDDAVFVRSNEFHGAGFDGFGALGFLAEDEDRFAEGGTFFLNAAGVGDEEIGAAHEVDERDVVERGDEVDVGLSGEQAVDGVLHVGVGVDGVDDLNAGANGESPERLADALETGAEAFAAVGGDNDETSGRVEERPVHTTCEGAVDEAIADVENGVDSRVAGDVNAFRGDAFPAEIAGGPRRGGEVEIGDPAGEDPVHLLGERLSHVPRAETGLDVTDGDTGVESRERAAEGRRRVALDDSEIGLQVAENRFECGDHAGRRLEERLARPHQVQVDVGNDLKSLEYLIEDLPVLRGDADFCLEHVRFGLKPTEYRAELDRFRPCAKQEEGSDGQRALGLLMTVRDAPFGQIVRRHFQGDAIARQNADTVPAQFTR